MQSPRVLVVATLLAYAPTGGPAMAEEGSRIVSRGTAEGRPSMMLAKDQRTARTDFRSFDFRAHLLGDGTWSAETSIAHRGLLCGNYEVGVRFGIGSPACTDVRWLSEPLFVTEHRQCNESTVPHAGGSSDPVLARDFARVSCAELVVRCSGNCK